MIRAFDSTYRALACIHFLKSFLFFLFEIAEDTLCKVNDLDFIFVFFI